MTITVDIGEAGVHLPDLLTKVEAGEEVIISRGTDPIARLTKVSRDGDIKAAVDRIFAARIGRKPTTAEEILQWRDEGRRY